MINLDYLNLLFNEDEWAGFGKYPATTSSFEIVKPPPSARFVTINPLAPSKDRRDVHVAAHRNFLVELDMGSNAEQRQYIAQLDLPVSTIVSSGGKSLHFMVCLDQPLPADTWRQYAKLILQVCKLADQSTKNPSRYTRLAGAQRDNGQEQKLIQLKERVDLNTLNDWLDFHNVSAERVSAAAPTSPKVKLINQHTKDFLINGAMPGERNNKAFQAATNLVECGFSLDYIRTKFYTQINKGYRKDELDKIIDSAVKYLASTR